MRVFKTGDFEDDFQFNNYFYPQIIVHCVNANCLLQEYPPETFMEKQEKTVEITKNNSADAITLRLTMS